MSKLKGKINTEKAIDIVDILTETLSQEISKEILKNVMAKDVEWKVDSFIEKIEKFKSSE